MSAICSKGGLCKAHADHFVCQWGGNGPRPPNPPHCFFKAIHACNAKGASCHHHVCSSGRLFGSFSLQMQVAVLSQPPSFFQAKHENKHHVITSFTVREGCADRFVCNCGCLHPPKQPCCFKPSMLTLKQNMSSPCLQQEKVARIIVFARRPSTPHPPPVLKPSMITV